MKNKHLLFITLGSLLSASGAFADDPNPTNTATPWPKREDTEMKCTFAGTFSSDKGPGWDLRCHAKAEFDADCLRDIKWVTGDRHEEFSVSCNNFDRDHDQIYSGKIMYGAFKGAGDHHDHSKDAIFTGTTTISPRVVVQDVKFDHNDHNAPDRNGGHDGHDRHNKRYDATLTLYRFGTTLTIPGVCEFEKDHHNNPTPTPAPDSGPTAGPDFQPNPASQPNPIPSSH